VDETRVCTSIIVVAELRYGVQERGSERLTDRLESVLRGLEVLPFESPADLTYGQLRATLESSGLPISGNDLLIGAHAVALDCTLVTDNQREFTRIPGLAVENRLR
jgi:tRNA(fMet)-specific endonuclease VapC